MVLLMMPYERIVCEIVSLLRRLENKMERYLGSDSLVRIELRWNNLSRSSDNRGHGLANRGTSRNVSWGNVAHAGAMIVKTPQQCKVESRESEL
jgi:hypothetical protein